MKKLLWIIITFPFLSLGNILPTAGTELSHEVDRMFYFIHTLSLFFGLLIIGAFVLFSILYRRKSETDKAKAQVHHNISLEIVWSLIPFLIFAFMFVWGAVVYNKMRTPYEDALEIHVYGQMWNWDFVYKNGKRVVETMYVPVDTPVKLILSSRDVIHSFYVPSFRIKQDALPGRYTALWFKAAQKGLFNVFCTELCGAGHSQMNAKIQVLDKKDWEMWLAADPYEGLTLIEMGQKVFQGRCTACHQIGTQRMIGPGLASLFNAARTFENGETIQVDENYIRESILNPAAQIVEGFPNQMTPFAGLLQEEELTALVEYIKSLK